MLTRSACSNIAFVPISPQLGESDGSVALPVPGGDRGSLHPGPLSSSSAPGAVISSSSRLRRRRLNYIPPIRCGSGGSAPSSGRCSGSSARGVSTSRSTPTRSTAASPPGLGTPEPFGLTPLDIREVVRTLAPHAAGFDYVEVAPFDSGQTAAVAAQVVREFIARHWVAGR